MEETGNTQREYDAFISYRHLPADKDCALRLQRLLERHKIKDAATGKMRRLRIFRDVTELPTSGDLGADIRNALQHSRFLIIVCSTSLKESRWCMEEIAVFRRLHGESNFHILPLLVEGEPDEAFPETLRREKRRLEGPEGRFVEIEEEVEPLGADVRARAAGKRRRLLRTEYLRIAAPILGCGFEDLYRRRQRKRRRQWTAAAAALASVTVLFTVYNMFLVGQISKRRDGMYEKQSLQLAAASLRQTEAQNYALGMLLAEAALPEDAEHPDRPVVAEAETALRTAVTARRIEEETAIFQKQADVQFAVESWALCGVYDRGRKAAVTDYEYTYLYDTGNGECLFTARGVDVYFDSSAKRAVRVGALREGQCRIELYETGTGELYFTELYERKGQEEYFGVLEEETQNCYIVRHVYEEAAGEVRYEAVARVDAKGNSKPLQELPQEIGERCRDGYMYSYFSSDFSSFMTRSSSLDSGDEKEAETLRAELEESGCTVQGITATKDHELFLFHIYEEEGYTDSDGALQHVSTAIWSRAEACWLGVFAGEYLYENEAGLLYQMESTGLNIYSYCPQNIRSGESGGTYYKRVSADGQRCMTLEDRYAEEGDSARLCIWDTDDLSEPLFDQEIAAAPAESRYLYFLSGDMRTVFYGTIEGKSRLWKEGEGCVLEFEAGAMPDDADASGEETYQGETAGFLDMMAMDETCERLAVAYGGRSGKGRIEIRRGEDGSLLQELETGEAQMGTEAFTHLEFEGSQLLASTSLRSVLVDLEEGEVRHTFAHGNQGYNQDHFLTEDGLLFCTEYYTSAYCLSAVYETDTGKQVFAADQIVRRYAYDAQSGVLAYQLTQGMSDVSTSLHLASRNKDGIFADTRSVVPEEPDLMLGTDGQSLESPYVLLNGSKSLAVYDIRSGEQVLTVADRGYALVGGRLYDLEQRTDRMRSYPLLTIQELQEEADRFLTSELGRRELGQREKEEFFIS